MTADCNLESVIALAEARRGIAQPGESKLELVSLADLFNRPEDPEEYLVDNLLIRGGSSIFAGKPKTGKTTLVRQLALAVARGEPFLGRTVIKGPVIYLAVEEKATQIKQHFQLMGATGSEEIYIHASIAPPGAIEAVRSKAEELKPALIIIDTLFRVVRVGDSNDYAAVTNALEPLQDLARATNCHVLSVHHMGKMEREAGDGVLGSTAIAGAFDAIILLNRKDRARTIKSIQRYGDDLEETILSFDEETRMSSLGSSKDAAEAASIAAEILVFLTGFGAAATEADIGCAVGGNKQRRLATLRQLVNAGQVLRGGRGGKGDPYRYSRNPNAPLSSSLLPFRPTVDTDTDSEFSFNISRTPEPDFDKQIKAVPGSHDREMEPQNGKMHA